MFRIRNPRHTCNHFKQKRWDKLKRKWPFLPALLIIGHLMVHEVPMLLLGGWALTEHCHHHNGDNDVHNP